MAEVKIKDLADSFGDYRLHYRRVTGNQCPEIVAKKTWIQVGDVHFRPDDFVQALERMKNRPDFEKRNEDISNIQDYAEVQKAKNNITSTLNKMLSLNNVNPEELGALKLNLDKALEEIIKVEKKYCLFE